MKPVNFRKMGMIAIPFIGCTSIIGTGFALWVFNKDGQESSASASLNVEVSAYADVGVFDGRSLMTKGYYEEATHNYIFPEILVFEEGHGLENDLTKGLNFYKKVTNPDGYKMPAFTTEEPYLDDETLITFYRDTTQLTAKELEDSGMALKLEVRIGITNYLSNIITVLDSFGAKKEVVEVGTNSTTYYTFNYTPEATFNENTKIKGSTLKTEIKKDLTDPTALLTEPDKLIEANDYVKYDYTMNFSKIFRYTSIDKKPTTVAAYEALQEVFSKKNEKISFKFYASYVPKDEALAGISENEE